MLTDVISIVGVAGLILSLILLAWQTRAVAEQTKISNSIAGAGVLSDTGIRLREIYVLFLDNPGLRPYFYSGKQCLSPSRRRRQVITIAEMFADTLESGLYSYRILPSSGYLENWSSYCRHMLAASPILNELIQTYPHWWPSLHAMLSDAHSSKKHFRSFTDLLDNSNNT